jgi:four helix bundle protein
MYTYAFEKLNVWQQARKLTKEIYLITSDFPSEEKFGLVSQMRRAVISVSSNIAEGSSRHTDKDQAHFYSIAYSSLVELLNQLILSFDLELLKEEKYIDLRATVELISNHLNNLRKSASK